MISNYEDFKKEIFKMTKIDLNAYKEKQMKRRIDSLIEKNKYENYHTYVLALKSDKKLFDEFVNYLTINVSEFYRNPPQWDVFENELLVPLLREKKGPIKIWSAACSTGDEPYTIAMIAAKHRALNQIKIVATDIDAQVLEKAKMGIYAEKSLVGLPTEYKTKHFSKNGNYFNVSEEIKKQVEFKQHNLLLDSYPTNCDIIVCRNVLIYFTDDAKDDIFKKYNKSLVKGGTLFVGSTEQIILPQRYHFKPVKTFFYRKENEL